VPALGICPKGLMGRKEFQPSAATGGRPYDAGDDFECRGAPGSAGVPPAKRAVSLRFRGLSHQVGRTHRFAPIIGSGRHGPAPKGRNIPARGGAPVGRGERLGLECENSFFAVHAPGFIPTHEASANACRGRIVKASRFMLSKVFREDMMNPPF
jgi:hypothetical protein